MAVNGSAEVRPLSQLELVGHLFRRAGFGASRDELEAALAKGYEATLEELLHPEQAPDLEEDLLFRSFPDFHETRKVDVAAAAWVWRMIHTQRPLEEKMVLFWHCLFATGNCQGREPSADGEPDRHLPPRGAERLPDHPARAVARPRHALLAGQPAQHQRRPQRELRPRAARTVLDGHRHLYRGRRQALRPRLYRLDVPRRRCRRVKPYGRFRWAFEFRPDLHDDGEKAFLGERGPFDGTDVIDIIVRQPATGRFLATRLYLFFVADHPDPEAIDYLAAVYHESQYDIRAMLRALFLSPFFRSERAYYAKVKSPAEHVVGIMRLVGDYASPKPGFGDISLECRYMGQDLLNPPSVEGWHMGKEWIDTGCLVERVNFGAKQLGDISKPGVQRIIERLRAQGELSPEQFVDGCLDLLGPLDCERRRRARRWSNSPVRVAPLHFDDENHAAEQRVAELLSLIAATREFQMA